MKTEFRAKLEALINAESMENGSDTPDFILAEYLTDMLEVFDRTVRAREKWYGRVPEKIPSYEAPPAPQPGRIQCDGCQRLFLRDAGAWKDESHTEWYCSTCWVKATGKGC